MARIHRLRQEVELIGGRRGAILMAVSTLRRGGAEIVCFDPLGPLANNVYLVAAQGAEQEMVIDPAMGATAALAGARPGSGALKLGLIVATHRHWDHVAEAGPLAEASGAPIAAHRLEAETMARPMRSTLFPGVEAPPAPVSRQLEDGDTITLGELRFEVLHTPGHTPGSICLYLRDEGTLFSGDTLFAGSYGRHDLPGGDGRQLVQSLRRLAALPPETVVLPGHGGATTIGAETWLQRFWQE